MLLKNRRRKRRRGRGVKSRGGRRGKEGEGAGPASPSPLGKESVYLAQRVLTDSPETNVEQKDESKAVSDLFQSRARRAGF